MEPDGLTVLYAAPFIKNQEVPDWLQAALPDWTVSIRPAAHVLDALPAMRPRACVFNGTTLMAEDAVSCTTFVERVRVVQAGVGILILVQSVLQAELRHGIEACGALVLSTDDMKDPVRVQNLVLASFLRYL